MGRLKTSILYLPRPATKYPGCYPMHFERKLPDILETTDYVHLFAGMATTGFRIDIKPELNPDMIADVHDLKKIEDDKFAAGIADPPYTAEFADKLYNTKYPQWGIWTKEFIRIIKIGGRIAIMHNYIVPRLPNCQMEEIIVILTRIKQYPKIVTIQRKVGAV